MPDPIATAVPTLYIDVTVNGQKVIYDLESANALYEALGNALMAMKGPAEPPPVEKRRVRDAVKKRTRSRKGK